MHGIFLDIETTGLDPSVHVPIEIAFKIIDLSLGTELASFHAIVRQSREIWDLRDPKSIEINGFSWEKLLEGKTKENVRQEIIEIFQKFHVRRKAFVYICQNPSFDRVFFQQLVPVFIQEEKQWPYHWLDLASMYWALQVKIFQSQQMHFPDELNLSKNAIANVYHLPAENIPHEALNGVAHLMQCYQRVVGWANFSEAKVG